jgi:tetratricopeptide (TPR) repeat protein
MNQALIKKLPDHEWLEFISRLGLVSLGDAREIFLSGDYSQISDLSQRALYTAGRGKTLSMEGNLMGSKMTLDEALLIAETRNAEQGYPGKDEILAYVQFELAVFWDKFGEKLKSLSLFRSAKRIVESPSLDSIIDFNISTMHLFEGVKDSHNDVRKWVDFFANNGMQTMHVLALRTLAKHFRTEEEYQKAIDLQIEALELAIEFKYAYIAEQIKNSYGYTLYSMGKIKEAQELFSGLIQSADSRYLRSTILENLTLTYNAEQKYEQAAEYLSQAIEHSQKYDILSQLPDECLFLGDLYREKLQQPELATYYYEIGSRAALKMAEHGFSLKGDRLDVVNRFENRPKVGYSLPESLTPKAERFAFADGLTWKQINDLFQFHLIKSHLESGMAIADLPEKLELKSSTYYAIKRRLNQHGYNLSDDLTTAQLKSKHAVSLKSYVNGFQELSWSQANQRFEKEIIEYLFKQVGYHKNKLADELGVSYPTILQKTKSLGQG